MAIEVKYLGRIGYEAAWALQEEMHAAVQAGEKEGVILLLEHDPVVTITKKPEAREHLVANPQMLAAAGIEVVNTNRGGDITYHGPGQLVAYPILNLNTIGLNVRRYVALLEETIIQTVSAYGIEAHRDACAVGVWVGGDPTGAAEGCAAGGAKIAAIGVRVKRWVSLHGLALNVTTDLSHFDYIVPCGLTRPVTSIAAQTGKQPSVKEVGEVLVNKMLNLMALPDAAKPHVPSGR